MFPHFHANTSCLYILTYSTPTNPFTHSLIHLIIIHLEIWRHKAKIKYKSIVYHNVDDDLYVFKAFGKGMTRSPKFKP